MLIGHRWEILRRFLDWRFNTQPFVRARKAYCSKRQFKNISAVSNLRCHLTVKNQICKSHFRCSWINVWFDFWRFLNNASWKRPWNKNHSIHTSRVFLLWFQDSRFISPNCIIQCNLKSTRRTQFPCLKEFRNNLFELLYLGCAYLISACGK